MRGTNVAAYADAAIHPIQRLALRGGIRVDGLSYAAEDRVNAQGVLGPAQARAAQGAHFGKKLTVDYALLPRTHVVASPATASGRRRRAASPTASARS